MSRKKQKTQHVTTEEVAPPKRDLISTLPWELIAEILGMTSPKEVLALARCSRHFCNSLVTIPRSKRIWEDARKSCNPALPDPTPNFTEPAYAAYVFDGGACEQCGKFTDNFYTSFSLRLRLCSNNECFPNWKKENAFYPDTTDENIAIKRWLLCSEGGWNPQHNQIFYVFRKIIYSDYSSTIRLSQRTPDDGKSFYRKSQFMQAERDYKSFLGTGKRREDRRTGRQLYHLLHEKDEKKKGAIMDLSQELVKWKVERSAVAEAAKRVTESVISKIAGQEGWRVKDILSAPTCAAKLTHYNHALEPFSEQDFNLIKADVEAEITKVIEKRARSEEEQAYAKRRELVALDYQRKKSAISAGPSPAILPTLNVFREQTVIKAIQNKQGSKPEDVSKKLKDQSVKEMIDDSLSAWKGQATKAFLKILGIDKYSAISTKKLHPVDRLTARFLCTKCLQHTSDEGKVPPLDFRAACAHQCPHLTKKQKRKAKWTSDQFELDHKAIKVTRELLALLNVSDDDKESLQATIMSLNWILCKTCNGKIIMNFKAMQRHSHRHEDMEIELLSTAQARKLKSQPIHWGLCAELTSMAKSAPRKAELRKYGCRHCLQHENPAQEEPIVKQMETNDRNAPLRKKSDRVGRQPKLMSFNGMRCHVLQSHGISHIDDEDIYRVDDESDTGQDRMPRLVPATD